MAWVISSNDSAVPSFVFAYAWNSLISSSYDEHGSLKVSAIFFPPILLFDDISVETSKLQAPKLLFATVLVFKALTLNLMQQY